MSVTVERVGFRGWPNNIRISNGRIELVVTSDVGPRVIHCGFTGKRNLFAEMKPQLGKKGEREWMIRGGHRLWIAPEEKPKTYELDNCPVQVCEFADGIRTLQPPGTLSGVQKAMTLRMAPGQNTVTLAHTLTNRGRRAVCLAPWALTVMAPGGMAVIPLPAKVAHTKRLTHNQEWSIWGYTDFGDRRWRLGSRYVFLRQSRTQGPTKLGLAQREGWAGYLLGPYLFVKHFAWIEGAHYPDGGVNFEVFTNQDFLEIESLGPLGLLKPGKSVTHVETWRLYEGVPCVKTEADADRVILPRIRK